ncbi:MAG: hypothetical protein QOF61_2526, partial [Acidobacteriota bacterium]|nr:hypothetical protein [Acidobacteriota bacterium]
MVIETVAAGAIAFLSPYLAEAGKSFAKKVGEGVEEKTAAIYQSIKKKFAGDTDAERTLALVEAKPESDARRSSLAEVLVDKM